MAKLLFASYKNILDAIIHLSDEKIIPPETKDIALQNYQKLQNNQNTNIDEMAKELRMQIYLKKNSNFYKNISKGRSD